MKYFFFILTSFLIFNCKSQNTKFDLYLKNFKYAQLPIIINRNTYDSIFYPNKTYHEITKPFIQNFIFIDTSNFKNNSLEYRYDYGIRYKINNFYIAIIHKQKYEGKTAYDFDLSEIVLIVYSVNGKIISKESIGKDNDMWISSIQIKKDRIITQQIKILELNKPELKCEIINKELIISQNGIIENIKTNPAKNGVVIWDERLKEFRLK